MQQRVRYGKAIAIRGNFGLGWGSLEQGVLLVARLGAALALMSSGARWVSNDVTSS